MFLISVLFLFVSIMNAILWTVSLPDLHFIKNYEIVTIRMNNNHEMERISLKEKVKLSFHAYGRNFYLNLHRDPRVFLPTTPVEIHEANRTISKFLYDFREAFIYEGIVEGVNNSNVHGYFHGGSFVGMVDLQTETYYLEPAENYLNDSYRNKAFVYENADVLYPECKKENRRTGCKTKIDYILHPPIKGMNLTIKKSKHQEIRIDRNKICSVQLFSDHTFFERMNKNREGTIAEMMYHLKVADSRFRETDFDQDGKPDGIGFRVAKVTVFESKHRAGYRLAKVIKDSNDFLLRVSSYIQNSCVMACFCNRKFEEGVVGLAFTAKREGLGGICQAPLFFSNGNFSFNSLFVTTYEDKYFPKPVLSNALTHELGHSFGSDHDPPNDPVCSPGNAEKELGNYVMYAYAQFEPKPRESTFSPCSLQQIKAVVEKKGTCFEESAPASCGNAFTEQGEDCDCGDSQICDKIDKCCAPKGGIASDKQCTVKGKHPVKCSPQEAECCSKQCTPVPADQNILCLSMDPCRSDTVCDGKSSSCPLGDVKKDGTTCLGTYLTCRSGKCSSNVCKDHELKMCDCSTSSGYECQVCCIDKSKKCQSASELGYRTSNGQLYVKLYGSPCNEMKGICNGYGKCTAEYEGPKYSPETPIFKYWPYFLICFFLSILLAISLIIYSQWFSKRKVPANR